MLESAQHPRQNHPRLDKDLDDDQMPLEENRGGPIHRQGGCEGKVRGYQMLESVHHPRQNHPRLDKGLDDDQMWLEKNHGGPIHGQRGCESALCSTSSTTRRGWCAKKLEGHLFREASKIFLILGAVILPVLTSITTIRNGVVATAESGTRSSNACRTNFNHDTR